MNGEALTTGFVAREMRARGYRVVAGPDMRITAGAADSRGVRPGYLFAAFRGEVRDGNDYVADAVAAGAAAVICERIPSGLASGPTIIQVKDTRTAIAELARAWRVACPARVVGVTGTVGKTTAKELIAATLAERFSTHRSEGNMNSREGLPLALLSLRRDHEISVLEMAMDSPGEIAELCRVARPEIGIVLNIGLTHVSKLGSIDAIAREKLSLVRSLPQNGTAILNAEDSRVDSVSRELRCNVIRFGTLESGAPLCYHGIEDLGLRGTRFMARYNEAGPVPVISPLPGLHTIPAALAALATGIALGLSLETVAGDLSRATAIGRMRALESDSGATILDDRYNSSPASLLGALRTLSSAQSHQDRPGRRVALLGPMAELGPFEEAQHRAAGRAAASHCDLLFAVGDPCRALVEEASAFGLEEAHWFADKDEAAQAVRAALRPGDVVLLKASRGQAFETLLPVLTGGAS